MRLILILLFTWSTLSAVAGKSYSVTYHVLSLVTEDPVVGMVIELNDGKKVLGIGVTNGDGKVQFDEITAKEFWISTTGEHKDYLGFYVHKENKAKVDIKGKQFVRFNNDKATHFFEERDKKYTETKMGFLEFLNDDTTKNNCSIDDAIEASFDGGTTAMHKYIGKHIRYPQESIENNEQGKIYLSFIIEPNGEVSNVTVENSISPKLDLEAMLLVYHMPHWLPAKCGEMPMRMRVRMPIVFKIY